MANKVIRVVVGIIIACAVLVGVYFVLPGQYKYPITQALQENFQSDTAMIANTYKNMKVPNNDMTFDEMLKGACSNPAWVVKKLAVDKATGVGTYEVHAYGYKVTISMPKENGEDNTKTYTDRNVEITFYTTKNADGSITNTGYELSIYDELQDDYYRQAALDNLCSQAK